MARRIYLDLDGVMADFDRAFKMAHGVYPNGMHDDLLWPLVYKNPRFFAELPMCEGAADFMLWLRRWRIDPIICTACPKSRYQDVAVQKIDWVHRNLGLDLTILPVMGGRHKWLFMHKAGDVLIDDFEKNLKPWREAGGVGIHHQGDFEATKDALRQLILPQVSVA